MDREEGGAAIREFVLQKIGGEMAVQDVKELIVYRKSYDFAMRIFCLSKKFPRDEVYALTSQIRRASRSVSQNLREAWVKRRFEASFISKLTDCDAENSETDTCLDFALDCEYITQEDHRQLTAICSEVGKMLGSMINKSEKFLIANRTT